MEQVPYGVEVPAQEAEPERKVKVEWEVIARDPVPGESASVPSAEYGYHMKEECLVRVSVARNAGHHS